MATFPALIRKHKSLHRQYVELEHAIAEVEKQIAAIAAAPRASTRKRPTRRELVETVKQAVKVLRDAGEPLPRREIAARLGITPLATSYRLAKAMELRFVERVSSGYYQTTNVVPAF
jgi:methylphosphotriester-DNA--protein-cysteine methyltransferase